MKPVSPLQHRLQMRNALDDNLSTSQGSDSGVDADKIEVLSKALRDIQAKYHAQEKELARTKEKLRALEAVDENSDDGDDDNVKGNAEADGDENVKMSSARQQLRRFCTKRANGTMKVPAEVYTQYWAGGADRDKLLKMFVKNGCSKTDFLKEVQVISEKEKSLNMEVAGDFHTETDMREKLKLSECSV